MTTKQTALLHNSFLVLRLVFGLFLLVMTVLADSIWVRLACLSSGVALLFRAYRLMATVKRDQLD